MHQREFAMRGQGDEMSRLKNAMEARHPEVLTVPVQCESVRTLESLKHGKLVSDKQFDQVFPEELQGLSHRHWTPLRVARRAANFLACSPSTKVLDIGSGPGKFCLIGAITTQAHFFGVEQRKSLTDIATAVASRHRVSRATFINMNMADLDWTEFQSFYFYNPFQEQLDPTARIDDAFLYSLHLCEVYLELVRTRLSMAPTGTRVAAFHGIGLGLEMPDGYELVSRQLQGTGYLELWIKPQ